MTIQYVDLSKYGLVLEPRYYFYGWTNSGRMFGRPSAVKALIEARCYLPSNYNFKIWDFKRSRKTQQAMRNSFRKRLRLAYPRLTISEIDSLVDRFGARLPKRVTELGTHSLGGAVDLTIVTEQGEELYMGTDHDDLTAKAALDYYETRSHLSALDITARRNRKLLKTVMLRASFKPYAHEWWHWSFDF